MSKNTIRFTKYRTMKRKLINARDFMGIALFCLLCFGPTLIQAQDSDGDGVSDIADVDDDNDGITDIDEGLFGNLSQINFAGIARNVNPLLPGEPSVNFNTDINGSPLSATLTLNPPTVAGLASGGSISSEAGNGSADILRFELNNARTGDQLTTSMQLSSNQFVQFSGTSGGSNISTLDSFTFTAVGAGPDFEWFVASSANAAITVSGNSITIVGANASTSGNFAAFDVIPNGTFTQLDVAYESRGNVGLNSGRFMFSFANPIDTDGDGIPDYLDVDSDNDGCNDALEAGFTDANNDGEVDGTGISGDGQVTGSDGYTGNHNYVTDPNLEPCTDTDNDGIADIDDIDDDNDGVLDTDEEIEKYHWSDVATVSGTTATGTVNGVGYTYVSSHNITETGNFQQGGDFPVEFEVPGYQSIQNIEATTNTITFDTPMENPVLVFSSLGSQGNFVHVDFSDEIELVWGYFASATGPRQIRGADGRALVRFPGTYTTISFTYLQREFYSNVRVGQRIATDTDGDGTPNYLDLDSDNDGCSDAFESGATTDTNSNFSFNTVAGTATDTNSDGLADIVDTNLDGMPDYPETYAWAINTGVDTCTDTDGDGVPDFADADIDNDGIYNSEECFSTNHALAGTASMHSQYRAFDANHLINGDRGGNPAVTLGYTPIDWVEIDLGASQQIDEIVIWNRTDCCTNRLGSVYIMVADTPFPNIGFGDARANANFISQLVSDTTDETHFSMLVGVTGRYVRIQKSGDNLGDNVLNVNELEIFEYNSCDADGDTIPNYLDTDSDGDGCNDVIEADYTDADSDGRIDGTGINNNGTVIGSNGYTGIKGEVNNAAMTSQCNDNDNDGLVDADDLDDDNDGVLDIDEGSEKYHWSNVATVSGNTATGIINGVGYTYTSSQPITETGYFQQANDFPAQYEVPGYLSIQNIYTTTNTITFDSPIENPVLAFSSLGSQGNRVSVNFSEAVQGIWGFFAFLSGPRQLYGTEGRAVVLFPGTYTSITFTHLQQEFYSNIRVGQRIATDTDDDGIPNYLDLDSDNDGCSDAREVGATTDTTPNFSFNITAGTSTDANSDGLADAVDADLNSVPDYTSTYEWAINANLNSCVDTDNDGTPDIVDVDADNDGIFNTEECNATNLALGGTATMSSQFSAFGAGFSNDGNLGPAPAHTGGTSTGDWLELDLGANSRVDEVVIWNRTDCCPERLGNVYLMVADTPFPANTDLNAALANADFSFQLRSDTAAETSFNILPATMGRYVRLQKSGDNPGGNWLNINELQIFQYSTCDTDADTVPDYLDLDSDGDGCNDVDEARFTDTDGDGQVDGTGINTNGSVAGSDGYTGTHPNVTDAGVSSQCTDTDNDGIPDLADFDDDNDGITDLEECPDMQLLVNGSFEQGPRTSNITSILGWTVRAGNIDQGGYVPASDGNIVIDLNGSTTGVIAQEVNVVVGNDYTLLYDYSANGTNRSFRAEVRSGDFATILHSSAHTYSGGAPMAQGQITFTATETPINIQFRSVIGGNQGNFLDNIRLLDLNTRACDTDTDGTPDHLDLDSDGDGCNDVLEAGFTDGDDDGVLGSAPVTVDSDGLVTSGVDGYTGTTSYVTDGIDQCTDTDNDGILDIVDIDDDNDGLTDAEECQSPTSTPPVCTNDSDGDGIFDSLDLDADNDGIYDVVEGGDSGLDTNGDGSLDSNDSGFVDANGNGMHDTAEGTAPIDTDGDGVADAIEIDSDADGCFDTEEAGFVDNDDDGQVDGSGTDAQGLVTGSGGYTGTHPNVTDATQFSNNCDICQNLGSLNDPIIEFFTAQNGDTDPDNDVEGEIAVCSNDGSQLAKLFLCGNGDSQSISLNIPSAQGLTWEVLDEASCAASSADCANTGQSCSWNQVTTGNTFNANTAGAYRLTINFAGGCFRRFYFEVFQDNIDVLYTKNDIICGIDGDITVTNLGNAYGYRLVNQATNTIEVPFSANNGPSFAIAAAGTYRVEATPLDAMGDPITGACIFETPDIVVDSFDISLNVTPSTITCNVPGTIRVEVFNVFPNYSYELRLDDGTPPPAPLPYPGHPGGTFVEDAVALTNSDHTFSATAGNYFVVVRTDDGCVAVQNVTVNSIPDPTLTAAVQSDIGCNDGQVDLTPSGGDGAYQYAIWQKDGVDRYADPTTIPPADFQTTGQFTFPSGQEGDYVFLVVDANGCVGYSNRVTIQDFGALAISPSSTTQGCSGFNASSLTIATTGGIAPFQYSIDGGFTYQNTPVFNNLTAGTYDLRVLDASACDIQQLYTIVEPESLAASVAIAEDITCDPSGARVILANIRGGTPPYEYSFDGGTTYSTATSTNLLPGNYTIIVRDAVNCTYSLALNVPTAPTMPLVIPTIGYDCSGLGIATMTTDTNSYDYTYDIDGTPNTPDPTSNVFSSLVPGSYTVTTNYIDPNPPVPSELLLENFGSGTTTSSPDIGPAYCFEPQDGTPSACGFGTDTHVQDGEYTITQSLVNLYSSWRSPNDHTGNGSGRFLAINVGGAAGLGGVIYAKRGIEVLPNRDITISLEAFNLVGLGSSLGDPSIVIELVDPLGAVITSTATGNIPKNTDPDDWHNYTVNLNPGAATNLDIVIRTSSTQTDGNDLAIDDIRAFQLPVVCALSIDTPIVIEADRGFSATVTGVTGASCNGFNNGTISFEVNNFDSVAGFEYSLDGGTTYIQSMTSPVTTQDLLAAGSQTILIRKVDDTSCTTTVTETITEPQALVTTAGINTVLTCTNGGATITANASGGTPGYEFQLEDGTGTIVSGYDFATNGSNNTFSSLSAGTYVVQLRDANGCQDAIDTPLVIAPPNPVVFDVTSTTCYSGSNDATITVAVTDGNNNYQFSIDGGPWLTPNPVLATNYTFQNLTDGTYTINVRDGYGCVGTATVTNIGPALNAIVTISDVTSCANGSISISASGGDGNLVYAFVPTGTTPVSGDFGAANSLTITPGNEGTYDIYVRDNNGGGSYCEYRDTVTVDPETPLTVTNTPTDPQCNGGLGAIQVEITSGIAPYTIDLLDLDNGGASNTTYSNVVVTPINFFNLGTGNYTVTVTDAKGCVVDETPIVINNPDLLTATVSPILPSACSSAVLADYGFQFNGYSNTLGAIEFSADGGANWTGDNTNPGTSDRLMGYISGTTVFPSMRTVDGLGNTLCKTDLPPYIIPFPLDDLDITISTIVVNCNELQVTVQGTQGVPNYEYAFTDNPGSFNPTTAAWTAPVPGSHDWLGLIPGRTYVFYVRDSSGCVRQSSVNVNDITINPMDIAATFEPSCFGSNDAEITYTITDTDGSIEPSMRWELFDLNTGAIVRSSGGTVPFNPIINITGLAPATYYIIVTQIDGGGVDACISGTENLRLDELDALTATATPLQNISCSLPGLIQVQNIQGGGGTYTYTVTGPTGFTTLTATSDNPISIPANSPSGNYDVTLQDQFGCSTNLGTVALTLSPDPTITNIAIANCDPQPSITITAGGGTAPFFYSVDGGSNYVSNGGVFTNMPQGTYNISVLDANGCTDTGTAEVYPVLTASANLTKLLDCTASPNAEITIEVTNGSGNYDYEIDGPGANDQARTVLPSIPFIWNGAAVAGTYTVILYDTNTSGPECERTLTVEVPMSLVPSFTETHTDSSCNGADNGTITLAEIDTGIGALAYSIAPLSGTFNTATNSFENLPPGNYTVTAVGTNACTTAISGIIISEPNTIVVTAPMVTDFDCPGNPATITIDPTAITGGSGTYSTYVFINNQGTATIADDVEAQRGANATYIVNDIAGGDFDIFVYDSNGCAGSTTATVNAFDELLSISATLVPPVSCNGDDIDIEVTGFLTNTTTNLANYEFRELPSGTFQTSNRFNDLGVGNHLFEARNRATGCTLTVSHQVVDPNTFTMAIDKQSDVVCHGTETGVITITLVDANYVGPFTWSVYNTNGTLANIADDTIYKSGVSATNGPTAPITLFGGTYRVEVTQNNAPDCANTELVTITAPSAPLSIIATQENNVSCTDDQGQIRVEPSGGIAPYNVTLTNATTGQTYNQFLVGAFVFENLTGGSFDIQVEDTAGCIQNYPAEIVLNTPDPVAATISSTILDCHNDTDASVTAQVGVRVHPLNPVYEYQLLQYGDMLGTNLLQIGNPQAVDTFLNLSSGYYSILVTDSVGCSDETPIVEILNPTPVNAQLLNTAPLTCTTGPSFELRANGGTGNFEYYNDQTNTWMAMTGGGGTTETFPNANYNGPLAAGSYQFRVRDTNSCEASPTNEIIIQPIDPLILTVDTSATIIFCNGESTGIIQASATGGLGNYQYELFTDLGLTTSVAGPLTTGEFRDLSAGTYYVTVVSEDCSAAPQQVIITEPAPLVVNEAVINVSCEGEDNGSITVALSGGSGDYQYAISPNLNQFDDQNTFEDLSAGTYEIIAQDSNGCFEYLQYTITEPTALVANATETHEVCNGDADGTISLTISGGTAPYSTALNNNDPAAFVQGMTTFENLAAQTHVVFIRDAQGCEINVIVDIEEGVDLDATVTPVYECTGNIPDNSLNIVLNDTSVANDLLYAIDSIDPTNMQLTPDFRNSAPGQHYLAILHANGCLNTIDFEIEDFQPLTITATESNLNEITASANGGFGQYTYTFNGQNHGRNATYQISSSGSYEVTVTDDNGCTATTTIEMEFFDIEVPNFFTPDGDGLNDRWAIENSEGFPDMVTKIFDRYGRQLYVMLANDQGWDGLYQDSSLPTGSYWYIIKINGENDEREFIGHFTLYR